MWPREVFYCLVENENGSKHKKILAKGLEFVNEPGVYVLYRDDIPYYVGKASGKLRYRLWAHACAPGARYHNFWNFFSAFVIHDSKTRNLVEAILIAAMPTANGARPRIKKLAFSPAVRRMTHDIQQFRANPRMDFDKLTRLVRETKSLLKTKSRKRVRRLA